MAKRKRLKLDEYRVGYKHPPRETRFKPGQSGNSKGRPKGTRNLKTDLYEEINEKIPISEGRQIRPVSKQRAMVKRLVEKALKGDLRAVALLIKQILIHFPDTADPAEDEPLSEADDALLKKYLREYAQRQTIQPSNSGNRR